MRILEFIKQNCKNVEFHALGDIAQIKRGERVTKSNLIDNGEFPVISGGVKPMGYLNKSNREANTITIAQYGTAGYVDLQTQPFWANDVCYSVFPNEILNNKFLYYYLMKSQKYIYSLTRKAIPDNLPIENLKSVKIPVPSLEVQNKIVEVLDSFSSLVRSLVLEKTVREKQYKYYLNHLITNARNSRILKLGEVGEVKMCKRILKNQTTKNGEIPFYKIGTFGKNADAFISKELFENFKEKYSYPKKGDILISASGTIGRSVIFDGEPAYFQDSNIVWLSHDETKVINKFLYYFYQLNPWKATDGGTISRLYNDNVRNTEIPLPPLDEQERIVRILDSLNELANGLSAGIPKEIELRQKQYKYWRDRLLEFPSKDSK